MAFSFFKKSTSPEQPKSGATGHYRDLIIRKVKTETADAISVEFEKPEREMGYQSGQFLTLVLQIEGKEVRRAYSLCSSPVTGENPTVAVKRVKNGLVSNWVSDHFKVGQTVKVLEPMGHFTLNYQPDNQRQIVLFAGGSGITPMMSIIKSITTLEPKSQCTLIYGNRDLESIIFKNELDQLEQKFPTQLKVIHVLDNPPANWSGYSGYLSASMLDSIFQQHQSVDPLYMLCGPEQMMKLVGELLASRGVKAERIMKESFSHEVGTKPITTTSDKEIKAREVTIRYDGQEFKVLVPPDKTILATALGQGIDLPYSCQSGLCTACRGKALSGKVKLDEEDGLSSSEMAEGYVLTCVGHPLTDDVVIEIG